MCKPSPASLFDKAYQMIQEILAGGELLTDFAGMTNNWRDWFAENLTPVVWRVLRFGRTQGLPRS